MTEPDQSPHRFRIKGAKAEDFLQSLANKSFFVDWCFRSPKLPNGRELCDLLIVFDQTAIIWQAKDLKLDELGRYKPAEVEKNLRQLSGAYRQLFGLKSSVELVNARRSKEWLDPSQISEVFLISALLGEGEESFAGSEGIDGRIAHVFTRDFTEKVLEELDTISDFVHYLRAKQALMTSPDRTTIVLGGEENLLGYYLLNDRSFDRLIRATHVALEDGIWEELQRDERYLSKKRADRISYGWDSIIDRMHEGSPAYERVARELARPSRFERRSLAKSFYDMHVAAHEDQVHPLARRMMTSKDPNPARMTTYCFLFMDDSLTREQRKEMLNAMCIVARDAHPQNNTVIGIATEKRMLLNCSYDVMLFDYPTWSDEMKQTAARLRGELGIFKEAQLTETIDHEYPDPES